MASRPAKPAEIPLAISRTAPMAEIVPPISDSLNFIVFTFSPHSGRSFRVAFSTYFHFVNISSLRNVALAT